MCECLERTLLIVILYDMLMEVITNGDKEHGKIKIYH